MMDHHHHGTGEGELSLLKAYDAGILRKLGKFALPMKHILVLLVFLTAMITVAELALPYLLKITIDTCLTGNGEPDPFISRFLSGDRLADLTRLSAIFITLVIVRYILDFSNIILMTRVSQEIMHSLRMAVFDKIQKLSLSYFDRNPVGRLVTRVTNDVQALNELFTNVLIFFFKDLFILFGILLILFRLNSNLTLVIFSILPFIAAATIIFRIKVRNAYRLVRTELAGLNAFVQEQINGMEIIQLFAREKLVFGKFDEKSNAYYDSTIKQMKIMAIFNPFISFSSSFAAALVIWYGGRKYLEGMLTIGILVAFLEYARMFFRPLSDLTEKYNILQSALAAAERLFQILETDEEIPEPAEASRPATGSCGIAFDNVTFSYTPGIPVLENISFRIEPGESLAIVGPTGAGKSTIISLICRFYDVDSGRITFNGVDIRQLDKERLRSRIGLVLQDVFLFSGDVRYNIRLNNAEIVDQNLEEAAKYVNADTFINRLPEGYETRLTEGALTLSAGERQLLAFARALAHDPDLLILDEATSNIDTGTEEKIQEAIDRLMKDRTSIIIAHRLSTVQNADKILVIDSGRVHEMGNHDELLELGGIYHDLYSLA